MYTVEYMQFFDNEIVLDQAKELMELYYDILDLMQSREFGTKEGSEKYLEKMSRIIELQEMIYFRAQYSNEEDAKEYLDTIKMSLPFVAEEGETDPIQVFRRMKREIETLKKFNETT